ncbi:unnamed protein product [Rotaria sp. Silwood2]|nr:unnamed protein product [Rotaria sp. Silwood2]CAF2877569.1 unnamed protein product [Rotaria sp. Silwood2]CAF3032522.1 unnamed protein product [Rotaria sp. Silwood2]CAF3933919.1 unnamed protein product [Rotaria sp. Silwood2]CAF4043961.1 unnamed protein product [Rotaria sp. Silwood2]
MNISREGKGSNEITSSSKVLVNEAIHVQPTYVRISHYFICSLISTICFCPATGLIALAYSLKSSAKADVNFHDKAQRYSRYALTWNIISIILGTAMIIFTIFYYEKIEMKSNHVHTMFQQPRYQNIH